VICRDPRKEENDGDVKYLHFIEKTSYPPTGELRGEWAQG